MAVQLPDEAGAWSTIRDLRCSLSRGLHTVLSFPTAKVLAPNMLHSSQVSYLQVKHPEASMAENLFKIKLVF